MIEGISTRRVESTPALDPTLGTASRQQQDKRGERQPGAGAVGFGGILSQVDGPGQQGQEGQKGPSGGDSVSLSPEAQEQVRQLQQRDREVRSHEQAHISAGGPHVSGGASYTYSRGPDGRQYAVGGSVSIDTAAIPDDPDATLEKARMVRSAALAPGAPSAQDQSVAAQAASMEMQAQAEKRTQQQEEGQNGQEGRQKGQDGMVVRAFDPAGKAADAADGPDRPDKVDKADRAAKTSGPSTADRSEPDFSPASAQFRASGSQNTGYLFGAMEFQARSDRVAALYQTEQNKFIPTTMLAPNGTGIGIQV